jgi:hypothetical protein
MIGDQSQDPAHFRLVAADHLSELQLNQVDHHHPSRPQHVNVGRWVVVGLNDDPQAIDVHHRRHSRGVEPKPAEPEPTGLV